MIGANHRRLGSSFLGLFVFGFLTLSCGASAEKIGDMVSSSSGVDYRVLARIAAGENGWAYVVQRATDLKVFVYKRFFNKEKYFLRYSSALQLASKLEREDPEGFFAKIEEYGSFRLQDSKQVGVIVEHLVGKTLSDFKCDQTDLKAAAQGIIDFKSIIQQLLRAVLFAAKQGVVVEDINSDNIIITRDGAQPKIRLFDFDLMERTGHLLVTDPATKQQHFNHPMKDVEAIPLLITRFLGWNSESLKVKLAPFPEASAALKFLGDLRTAVKLKDPPAQYQAVRKVLLENKIAAGEDIARLAPESKLERLRTAIRYPMVVCLRILKGLSAFAVQ